ncbi:MAG TPA: SCO family protein [Acidimicrobiales bacterium]|nr:SCO family protein [Acidimicrobiales bacterium]
MSDEQRTSAFRPLSDEERRRALAEGTPKASSRYVGRFVAGVVLLGVIGLVADFYFGQMGTTPAPTLVTTPAATGPTHPLTTATAAFMGLHPIAAQRAPDFTLTDQAGRPWSLGARRGKVVVLAFFDATCTDICPVVGAEIRRADQLLGAKAHSVVFAVVNTDPHHFGVRADPPALARTGLAHLANVRFLTGPLSSLDAVWSAYGITVTTGAKAHQVSHNNLLYFVGPGGGLVDLASPFATASPAGYSLGPAATARWAQGIAQTAGSLVP